jgi:hypothetical protein
MPSFRRPPRTLISGLGVAGAVLAAVVIAFAAVSGIVAYSLTSVDPLPRADSALVLDPLRTNAHVAKPLVLRPAPPARRRAVSSVGTARSGVASARAQRTAGDALSPRAGRRALAGAAPQHDGAAPADRPVAPAGAAHAAPDPLLQPVGDAIGATGEAVGATTDSLARRLDTVTATVGAVTGVTTDTLRTTADRSGKVLGRLLGASPQR